MSPDGRPAGSPARSPLSADALKVVSALPGSPLRDRYVEHLLAHEDGVYRECSPDHLTASVLVLSHDHNEVLLTLHAKARQWFQFGGHCEPGDTTLAGAARREGLEESGLSALALHPVPVHLDEHAVPFCSAGPDTHHLDVRFVAVAPDDDAHDVSEESLDVRWWPVRDLPTDEPSIIELVRAALVVVADVDVVATDAEV